MFFCRWLRVNMSWVPFSLSLHPFLFFSMGDGTSVLPLAFLWQPLALLGCHITPSPLCCLSPPLCPSHSLSLSLSSASPLQLSMCLVSCVWQRCHYRAARITLPPPTSCLSALPVSLSLALHLLTLSIPLPVTRLWRLYVTFIPETRCPSQTFPIMPCTAAT